MGKEMYCQCAWWLMFVAVANKTTLESTGMLFFDRDVQEGLL
jgi:hypothetical protein